MTPKAVWSLEPSRSFCELEPRVLLNMIERGVYAAYDQSDRKAHIHLWHMYNTVVETGLDFDYMMRLVLMDGIIHESIHATFHSIKEHARANVKMNRQDWEELLVNKLMKGGEWTLD